MGPAPQPLGGVPGQVPWSYGPSQPMAAGQFGMPYPQTSLLATGPPSYEALSQEDTFSNQPLPSMPLLQAEVYMAPPALGIPLQQDYFGQPYVDASLPNFGGMVPPVGDPMGQLVNQYLDTPPP